MHTPIIGIVSLGCPKATVDSEKILTTLADDGYAFSEDVAACDLVIVNTCGFIEAARAESINTINELIAEHGKVIVTGCLGNEHATIRDACPGVLAITGTEANHAVKTLVNRFAAPVAKAENVAIAPEGMRLTPQHYAYIKIAEGCDQRCSFCIIPKLRGHLRSRKPESILDEARVLRDAGVREIMLVAQDTMAWGRDYRHALAFDHHTPIKMAIVPLLEALSKLGLWLRLHYIYPYPQIEHLIELMADGLILPYLDMPLQHADKALLRRMRRPASGFDLLPRLAKWREQVPDLTIRSTFITGFPGENDEAFQHLIDFVEHAEFDRLGAFAYSDVDGAEANTFADAVPLSVREDRKDQLMAVQADISSLRLQRWHQQVMTVLVDEVGDQGQLLARSRGDAPDIDGQVHVTMTGAHQIKVGDFVRVRIEDSDEYDLYGHYLGSA